MDTATMYIRRVLYIFAFILCIAAVFMPTYSHALRMLPPNDNTVPAPETAYRNLIAVPPVQVPTPTVVEIPLSRTVYEEDSFAILENETQTFVPYYAVTKYSETPVPVTVFTGSVNDYLLTDTSLSRGVDFPLEEGIENKAQFILRTPELVTSSGIVFNFDTYVALPTTIRIATNLNGGGEKTVVSETSMQSNYITFPATESNEWVVTLTYAQPMRINEIRLIQDDVEKSLYRGIRFLAQPQFSYRMYHNPDRVVTVATLEKGNLRDDEGVVKLAPISSTPNPTYTPADTDRDTVPDMHDNCVSSANTDQLDLDTNGRGDACDDFDRDGIIGSIDNCPNNTNGSQEDIDNDGIGDVCDKEESRITEKYPWIPWAGMGVAVLVLGVLFILAAMTPQKSAQDHVV